MATVTLKNGDKLRIEFDASEGGAEHGALEIVSAKRGLKVVSEDSDGTASEILNVKAAK